MYDDSKVELMMTKDVSIDKIKMQKNLVILKQWNSVSPHDIHYTLITITEAIIEIFNKIEYLEQTVRDKEN